MLVCKTLSSSIESGSCAPWTTWARNIRAWAPHISWGGSRLGIMCRANSEKPNCWPMHAQTSRDRWALMVGWSMVWNVRHSSCGLIQKGNQWSSNKKAVSTWAPLALTSGWRAHHCSEMVLPLDSQHVKMRGSNQWYRCIGTRPRRSWICSYLAMMCWMWKRISSSPTAFWCSTIKSRRWSLVKTVETVGIAWKRSSVELAARSPFPQIQGLRVISQVEKELTNCSRYITILCSVSSWFEGSWTCKSVLWRYAMANVPQSSVVKNILRSLWMITDKNPMERPSVSMTWLSLRWFPPSAFQTKTCKVSPVGCMETGTQWSLSKNTAATGRDCL